MNWLGWYFIALEVAVVFLAGYFAAALWRMRRPQS